MPKIEASDYEILDEEDRFISAVKIFDCKKRHEIVEKYGVIFDIVA